MAEKKAKQSSFLMKIDLYGNLFNFTINREEKFKTNTGAVLSIITYLLIIITSIFFGSDFYNRTNPKVLSQKTVPEKHSRIKITNKILTISWRIEDRYAAELDWEGKFYVKLLYSPSFLNPNTKNFDLSHDYIVPYKRCSESINEENFRIFKNPEKWYCFDFDIQDMMFGGDYDGEFVYSLSINLNVCKYDEKNVKTSECAKFSELKEFLDQRLFFSINFPSIYFDFTDYNHPLKIEYKNYYSHITRNLLRADFCYFNIPLLKDDRGWIFSEYSENSKISFNYCDRNYFIKPDEDYFDENSDDLIYGVDMYLEKGFPFYIRTYVKFQDLAATVGGFVKIITLIFRFVNFYLNNYERDKFIINYFFNILNDRTEENFNNNNKEYLFHKKAPASKIDFKDPKHQQSGSVQAGPSLNNNTSDMRIPAFKFASKFKSSIDGILEKQKLNNKLPKEIENNQTQYAEMGNMSRKKLNVNAENSEIFEIKKFQNESLNANLKNSVIAEELNNELLRINIGSKNSAALDSQKTNRNVTKYEKQKGNIFNPNLLINSKNNTNNETNQISGINFSIENFALKISKDETFSKIRDGKEEEEENNATVINKRFEQEESLGDKEIIKISRKADAEGKSNSHENKPREVFFLNESSNGERYLGFFDFQMHKYFSFKKKIIKDHNLFKTINYIRDHINDKFDLLKYYKRYVHYKYLKKVILSNEQRIALKNICNLKIDYKMIYKAGNNHFDNNNRDIVNIKNHLENDITDQRIIELINMKFY